jgi:hypothetical protein
MNSGAEQENHLEDLVARAKKFSLETKGPNSFYYHQTTDSSRNQHKILESLAHNHPHGRTGNELAKDTGLSPDTILTQGKRLIKNNLVYKNGKFGKYQLTSIALGAPGLRGFLFENKGCVNHIFSNTNFFSVVNKFTEKSLPKNRSPEEESLFVFANTVGAYIIYVMIEAMRTEEFQLLLDRDTKDKNLFGSGRDRDNLVKEWVSSAIRPVSILLEFCNLKIVKKGLRMNGPNAHPWDSPLFSWTEMDNTIIFEGLRTAFANLYPHIFSKLEQIRAEGHKEILDRVEELRTREGEKKTLSKSTASKNRTISTK